MNILIPKPYRWLEKEPGPNILKEALRWYGTLELPGDENNPVIIEWAKEVGGWISEWYTQDEIPWCGLLMALCAKRASFPFNQKALSALEWCNWGLPRLGSCKLGDVLVFRRAKGGHVGIYVGEDSQAFHVLGGNQSNMVCITRIAKDRLVAARHCPWRTAPPDNLRTIKLAANGTISENEA